MRRLRIILAAALALSSLASAADGQTAWQAFQPADGGYRVEFPGAPDVKRSNVQSRTGPAPNLAAIFDAPDHTYQVEVTTYSASSNPDDIFGLFVNVMAKEGMVPRTQKSLKVSGAPAQRFEVEMMGGKFVMIFIAVVDGPRVYELTCMSTAGSETAAAVSHFFDSFALVR